MIGQGASRGAVSWPGAQVSLANCSCVGLSAVGQDLEAAGGFEPPHRGFADLSLNHLGTPP